MTSIQILSPEERARALVTRIAESINVTIKARAGHDAWQGAYFIWAALIASAIKDAEDAARESVAARIDAQSGDHLKTTWGVAAAAFARDIRARNLKSQEPA